MQASHDISLPVFGVWKGYADLASDLGAKPDTVLRQLNRRRIPVHQWPLMIERATERGKTLTAEDLLAFNTPPPRNGRRRVIRRRKRSEARVS